MWRSAILGFMTSSLTVVENRAARLSFNALADSNVRRHPTTRKQYERIFASNTSRGLSVTLPLQESTLLVCVYGGTSTCALRTTPHTPPSLAETLGQDRRNVAVLGHAHGMLCDGLPLAHATIVTEPWHPRGSWLLDMSS
jgi:hypothetical protein